MKLPGAHALHMRLGTTWSNKVCTPGVKDGHYACGYSCAYVYLFVHYSNAVATVIDIGQTIDTHVMCMWFGTPPEIYVCLTLRRL